MAKKHFDAYYKNYEGYYLSTLEVTEMLIKEAEEGKITQERVDAYKKDAEPIIHTFRILQEIKRMMDRPVRPKKRAMFEKQYKRVVPLTDENDLDAIAKRGEEAVKNLKDLVE